MLTTSAMMDAGGHVTISLPPGQLRIIRWYLDPPRTLVIDWEPA